MTEFNADTWASEWFRHCCGDTASAEQAESELAKVLHRAFEAGRASRDAEIARLRASVEHIVNKCALSSGNHIGSALRLRRATLKAKPDAQ